MYTAESFGSSIPENWEEICDFLNHKYEEEKDIYNSNEVWERYWQGEYKNAPVAGKEL